MNRKRKLTIGLFAAAALCVVGWMAWRLAMPSVPDEPESARPPSEEEILGEMVAIERDLRNMGHDRADLYFQLAELREKAEKEDEEVARLVREFQEDRAILVSRLDALEGVPERRAQIEELQEENRDLLAESKDVSSVLKVRRAEQSVAGRLDLSDVPELTESLAAEVSELQKRQLNLYSDIKRNQQDMGRLQREIEAIHDQARKENWEIKELHRRAQEKQLLMQVRRDRAAGTLDVHERLKEMDRRQREKQERHAELEKQLVELR